MSIKQCKVKLVFISKDWRQKASQFFHLFTTIFYPFKQTTALCVQLSCIPEKGEGVCELHVNSRDVKIYCKTTTFLIAGTQIHCCYCSATLFVSLFQYLLSQIYSKALCIRYVSTLLLLLRISLLLFQVL
jgi:hypothetical protein